MFREARRGRKGRECSGALGLAAVSQVGVEDQRAYLELLLRGASPAAACQQLQLDLFVVMEAIAEDEEFRIKVDAVYDALSQNVAARLYQEAMKGSVSAMTQWLKQRPPPEWMALRVEGSEGSGWDALSDEELLARARMEGIAIPVELEGSGEASGGGPASAAVS